MMSEGRIQVTFLDDSLSGSVAKARRIVRAGFEAGFVCIVGTLLMFQLPIPLSAGASHILLALALCFGIACAPVLLIRGLQKYGAQHRQLEHIKLQIRQMDAPEIIPALATLELASLWHSYRLSPEPTSGASGINFDEMEELEHEFGFRFPRVFVYGRKAAERLARLDHGSPNSSASWDREITTPRRTWTRYIVAACITAPCLLAGYSLREQLKQSGHWPLMGLPDRECTVLLLLAVIACGFALLYAFRRLFFPKSGMWLSGSGHIELQRRAAFGEVLERDEINPLETIVIIRWCRCGYFSRETPRLFWEFCRRRGQPGFCKEDFDPANTPWSHISEEARRYLKGFE